ncbi:uncharacterized protein B0I36DRAFT_330349 [Microdochium trichocladiopsis]|uniref:F-box domain-containing protein n=1 Tax=Microdochium trichocladiopsis TaxID=1682393 RepID=A0A9P9BMW2_9PEZI|nr:uncharacterized protein B0I36DRAFT_330349 [Microdochium trichocladiopsis]KAH7026306.1 hypothetical protein B0I36DRAFT_330349 [Microdochium trichocladiopsis]
MERGKELYAQKHYPEAAKHFIRAIDSCPCGVAYRETSCLCKSILGAIEKKALKDELKRPCICSAKSGRRCERKPHIDAFDSLAAAREKQGLLDESISCTEQLINLSPRDPKGYLRLGKALRLQGKPTVAYEAYVAGSQLVAAKHPDHPLLPMLNAQAAKVKGMTRTDPLAKLPYELIRMILQDVGFRTLCLCLRVSKTWKAVLTSAMAQDLWRTQQYFYTNHKPRGFAGPRTALRYASFGGGQLTDLTIDNCKQFGLKFAHLTLIMSRCGKHLRHLKLRGPMVGDMPQGSVSSFKLPALESLYLGLGLKLPHKWLLQLLRDTSRTLRELSVFDVLPDPADRPRLFPLTGPPVFRIKEDQSWPELPRLKSLALSSTGQLQIYLAYMRDITPNLENLWLDDVDVVLEADDGIVDWPKLKSVFIGGCVKRDERLGNGHAIKLCTGMEELHLEEAGLSLVPYLDQPSWPELSVLRKFSIRSFSEAILESQLELLLRPGLESGTIDQISIHPFPLGRYLGVDVTSSIEWFRSESVTHLALSGFVAEGYRSSGTVDDALVTITSRFPNLKTLDIDKEQIQDATLGKIFARGVKTIYYAGDLREDLRVWAARTHNARLVYGPYRGSPAELPDRPVVSRRLAQSAKRVRERAV